MPKVKIQINGQELEADEGMNLIEAARLLGVEIPHFCYHPGLGVDGNCRMCLVEQEGAPKPQIACNTFVKEGLKIHTDNEKVKEWQRAVLEFLFLNHPLDCPICDQSGECFLQDYYMSNGRYESRLDVPKVHKRKVVEVGPRVTLDAERCVLCTRCIRFCDQITGTGELYIVNRSHRSEITTYPGVPLANDYSLNTVDICPVGALTSTDFRFKQRVWLLESTESICTGCARGCNVFLEHNEGVAYRLRPRENMEVNRYWMCDPGRLTYKALNDDRLDFARREGEEVPLREALATLGSWIGVARQEATPQETALQGAALEGAAREGMTAGVQILLSPASSTETLFAMKRLAAGALASALASERVGGIGTRPPGVEDELLRRADCYPNRSGLQLLGLENDPEPALEKGGALLLIVEDDPLARRPAWKQHIARFEHVAYLGTNENETSRAASLALPITPHSECDGTFVNFQGRVQRFRKGIAPRGDALWAPELLRRALHTIGVEFGWANLNQLWRDLASSEKEFAGIDVAQLGGQGQVVASRRAVAGDGRAAAGDGRVQSGIRP